MKKVASPDSKGHRPVLTGEGNSSIRSSQYGTTHKHYASDSEALY